MWTFGYFLEQTRVYWHLIAMTKPDNYRDKFRAIYRMVNGVPSLPSDFEPTIHEEIETSARYGYAYYRRAALCETGGLLLGPETIRQRTEILANFGISANVPYPGTVDKLNSVVLPPGVSSAPVTTGSVQSERYWWPYLNDAWILGGVHSLGLFYLHTPVTYTDWLKDDTVYDATHQRPRALGRELLTLHACRYRRVQHAREGVTGITLAPTDGHAATSANYGTIFEAVAGVNSAQEITQMLNDFVNYDHYDYSAVNRLGGRRRFAVEFEISGWEPSLLGSISVYYQILDGVVTELGPHPKDPRYTMVATNSRVRKVQHGHPSIIEDGVQTDLAIDTALLTSAALRRVT